MDFMVKYEVISPAVLASIVEKQFECLCDWHEINEDSCLFIVFLPNDSKISRTEIQEFVKQRITTY